MERLANGLFRKKEIIDWLEWIKFKKKKIEKYRSYGNNFTSNNFNVLERNFYSVAWEKLQKSRKFHMNWPLRRADALKK